MATLLYPDTIPGPSPNHELAPRETRDLVEGGVLGVRSRTRDQNHDLDLEFDFSEAELAIWWAWWRDDLVQGGNFFSANWLLFQAATIRFVSEPQVQSLPGLRRMVKIKAQVRGRSALPDTGAAPSFQLLAASTAVETNTPLVWTLAFSSPLPDTFTGTLSFSGTATTPADFGAVTTSTAGATIAGNTLTVGPGGRTVSLSMVIVNDAVVEADETLTMTVTRTAGTTSNADASATVTLMSDDTPTVSIADTTVAETAGFATFTITLSAASPSVITVAYYTEGATALPVVDYVHTEGTLVFQPGETAKTVNVPIISDGVVEGNETFLMKLQTPWQVTIDDGEAVCTIT